MIESLLIGAGVFLVGVIVGFELHRKARAGQPAIGPFRKSEGGGKIKHRTHPGSYPL